ncbi:universal stress protein [Desulfitobacterium chlororespirans]|uniref:Nucleotide-binding universal stress protein, UspA family n=1 Tax=Desulfitobacterium chlororespirans DSM 11544 TaxID=1121395 RepID=A0A1M7TGG2_9FIRM|nr:universal stress protein [Desulfitobacterium chlororespirans]SHN69800.1 Nucleotide-binding universal stress protein, UspA family [Desulfitobacterium chlororespirans DSM 11544]
MVRNILIPIDGTERSMKSVDLVKSLYQPNDVRIVLLMVREDVEHLYSEKEVEKAKSPLESTLDAVAYQLNGYDLKKEVVFGHAGEAILTCARQNDTDIIVMTKSTRIGWVQKIGSVTEHVVKYAKCIVMIVPENSDTKKSPRKMHQCEYLDDIITLSGQLSLGPNSCLLPVQVGKCIYKITVIEGSLRMNHLTYNPDGGTWMLPPQNHQPPYYDLNEGDEREIRLEILVNFGKMDHIEIVNTQMTKLLKFHYATRFESIEI